MSAADQKRRLKPLRVLAQMLKKTRDRFAITGRVQAVAGQEFEIAVRHKRFACALHGGKLDGRIMIVQLGNRRSHDRIAGVDAELNHFHPSMRERFDVDRKRESQQPRDFLRRRALRIDHLIDIQLVLQHNQAFGVFRIANARDGILRAELFRRKAADHVQLIAAGDGDDDVRRFNIGFNQRFYICAIAANTAHVQRFHRARKRRIALVDNRNIVPVLRQVLRKCITDLAAANDDDIQRKSASSMFRRHHRAQAIQRRRRFLK